MDLLRLSGYDSSSDVSSTSITHKGTSSGGFPKGNAVNSVLVFGAKSTSGDITNRDAQEDGDVSHHGGIKRPPHGTSSAHRTGITEDWSLVRNGRKRQRKRTAVIVTSSTTTEFTRSVPHVRGNWCGHVFVSLSSYSRRPGTRYSERRLHRAARATVETFRRKLEESAAAVDDDNPVKIVSHVPLSSPQWDSGSSSDEERVGVNPMGGTRTPTHKESNHGLHVSLSRPFYLQLPSISSFVSDLKSRLGSARSFAITFSPSEAEILVNDEGTRSFLTIPATTLSRGAVVRLIRCVDAVLAKYGQRRYYEEAKVHVSVASVSGDVRSVLGESKIHVGSGGRMTGEEDSFDAKEENVVDRVDVGGYNDAVGGNSEVVEEHAESEGEEDDEEDSDEEDSINSPITIAIDRVHCTFGTTKEFVINLLA